MSSPLAGCACSCTPATRPHPESAREAQFVDDSWGIVGSGNLTAAGLGGELIARANLELGVRLSARQIGVAIELFDGWWARAGEVTLDALAPYLDLEPIPPTPPTALKPIGKLIAPPPRPAPTPGIVTAAVLVKAMYGVGKEAGQWWLQRPWIHDHHRVRLRR
ncbi:MAG: hypothetical protein QOG30_169 [Acidimicrobiaceae bacterium]